MIKMEIKRNPWISIADLLSSVVLVVLLLFIMAAIGPKYSQEVQRNLIMQRFDSDLSDYESSGQLRVYVDKSILEFTSVTFDQGSAILNKNTKTLVKDIATNLKKTMDEHPRMEVLIEGHTDPAKVKSVSNVGGYYADNIQLSSLRAANVRKDLLKHMGNEYAKRMGVAGYGETRLRDTKNPYSAENRRIEIRILWEGQKNIEQK